MFGWLKVFKRKVEESLQYEDIPEERPDVSFAELRQLGLSGEFFAAEEAGTLPEFWERFGGIIRRDLPFIRERAAKSTVIPS